MRVGSPSLPVAQPLIFALEFTDSRFNRFVAGRMDGAVPYGNRRTAAPQGVGVAGCKGVPSIRDAGDLNGCFPLLLQLDGDFLIGFKNAVRVTGGVVSENGK